MNNIATQQQIIADYRQGLSLRTVGERHGISDFSVRKILKNAGVRRRPRTFSRRRGSIHPEGYVRWGHSYVHRIVCEAWHGPPPSPEHQVNHIDGDKTNNHPDNLEWVTSAENVRHARRIGLYGPPNPLRGEAHHQSKLTKADVLEIRRLWATGLSSRAIASRFGISTSSVRRTATGETWSHVPGALPQRCEQYRTRAASARAHARIGMDPDAEYLRAVERGSR